MLSLVPELSSWVGRQVSLLQQNLLLAVMLLRRARCAAQSPLVWTLLARSSLTASILRYAQQFWWSFGWLTLRLRLCLLVDGLVWLSLLG